jgi:hypothetical protein
VLGPEREPNVVDGLFAHVGLEQHLQNQFAGFTASTHKKAISRQLSVSLLRLAV